MAVPQVLHTFYPVTYDLVERLRGGGGADWLHDVGFGVPGASWLGWGLWSPFSLPALLLPLPAARVLGTVLCPAVAGLGAMLLARRLNARWAGQTSAVAIALAVPVLLGLGSPAAQTAAVAPLLLWAAARTADADARWWHGPVLVAAVAALVLGGALAVAALALAAITVAAVIGLRGRPRREALHAAVALATAVVIGVGIAAFTLGPTLALTRDPALRTRSVTTAPLTGGLPGLWWGVRDGGAPAGLFTSHRLADLLVRAGARADTDGGWRLAGDAPADAERWLALLGIGVWTDAHGAGHDVPGAVPVVRAAGEIRLAGDGTAVAELERLGPSGLRRAAVIEPYTGSRLPDLPPRATATTPARLLSWSHGGGIVRARVQAPAGGVLVTREQALGGWQATVNGRRSQPVLADHAFVGAVVPPGTHDVELRWQPPWALASRLTTGRSAGALLAWSLLRWLRQRTGKTTLELAMLVWTTYRRRWRERGRGAD